VKREGEKITTQLGTLMAVIGSVGCRLDLFFSITMYRDKEYCPIRTHNVPVQEQGVESRVASTVFSRHPSAFEQLSTVTVATAVPRVLDVPFDPSTMMSTQCDVRAAKPPAKRYSTASVLS
jgi:hypothetical protein